MAASLKTTGVTGSAGHISAKAWGFFNANGDAIGTIKNSYNVSSFDDDGDGLSQMHFSVTQANDDYSAVTGPGRIKGDGDVNVKVHSETSTDGRTRSTSAIAFNSTYGNATTQAFQDAINFSIAIIGD